MADRFYYGGQAVIEGVMMRGRKAVVTAVRRPSGGIVFNTQPLSPLYTGRLRKTPFVRGIIVLIEALVLGFRAIFYSANVSLEEEEEEISGGWVWLMVIASLGVVVALFFIVPLFLARLLDAYLRSSLAFNLVEGGIRAVIFIIYLWVIGMIPSIRRVFAYHGAEHKTINAFEDNVPLEVEEVRKHGKAHVRCGTSFIFVVLVIAILVFAVLGRPSLWLMGLYRIVLIPVIAAIGYEVIYFGARHADSALVRALLSPGMWLQGMTTREPDEGQLEVGMEALKKTLEVDRAEAEAKSLPSITSTSA
ncbi:MAG: DUF1385 domain-containing protein [Chloroflexi bacterium]|nr:DUF1385 domain-containing protein [Chloroflexota bacterium]